MKKECFDAAEQEDQRRCDGGQVLHADFPSGRTVVEVVQSSDLGSRTEIMGEFRVSGPAGRSLIARL